MEMIDLSRLEPQETLNHTSKGNQLKWKCDGYWYKADHMGYEGLAETIVSAMLAKSTIKYPFVVYEYSQIKYKDRVYSGCKSADFLAGGYDLIKPSVKSARSVSAVRVLKLRKKLGWLRRISTPVFAC